MLTRIGTCETAARPVSEATVGASTFFRTIGPTKNNTPAPTPTTTSAIGLGFAGIVGGTAGSMTSNWLPSCLSSSLSVWRAPSTWPLISS